ncbi:hypothetical protein SAMN02745174_02066 [Cetobacterium ceti]|uniref:Uncharacterized protein n=1 Tax=Cetobacterium ceti TaxID=180163 RepID=A0A1T4PVQ6_9FUSO|nr:S-4TM family putative pore-forming effector [Cetobacterium ceti]SJZ95539.1 hypothetical protein SAMN02745174_02066 [Cetobacterium ceti]
MKNRQNEERQLSLLCISELLYGRIKKIRLYYNFFLVLPILLSFFKNEIIEKIRITSENLNTFNLIITLAVSLLYFVFQFLEKENLTKAVKVQEEFDTKVFGLQWNDLLADQLMDIEIKELKEECKNISKKNKKDWYNFDENLNDNENIFRAQKSAIVYSRKLRERYLNMLLMIGLIIVVVFIIIIWKIPLGKIISDYFLPFYPIFQKYIDTIFKLKNSIFESKSVYKYLEDTDTIGKDISNLRILQDWIFINNRLHAPIIPTLIYKLERSRLEIFFRDN